MDKSPLLTNYIELRRQEASAVHERRKQLKFEESGGQSSDEIPHDLVGLALSGGGIRSAALGLGVLKGLHECRLLKFIDYLSTVSGGSYIGSAFSSAICTAQPPGADKHNKGKHNRILNDDWFPLDGTAEDGDGLSGPVKRIIYGGKYLKRPWEATNKYLIGLCVNLLLALSGLVFIASLIAIVWRLFDYPRVRDALAVFGCDKDLFVAMLPFVVALACWFFAWVRSYFFSHGEAPENFTQQCLILVAATFGLGTVMMLVNPYSTTGVLAFLFDNDSKLSPDAGLSSWLLAAIGAGLLPLLRPAKLMQCAVSPRGIKDKILFYGASTAIIVGIPLAIFGFIAEPGIGGTASSPDNRIRPGDVMSWPAFLGLTEKTLDGHTDLTNNIAHPKDAPKPLNAEEFVSFYSLIDEQDRGPLPEQKLKELYALGHRQLGNIGPDLADKLREHDRNQTLWNADQAAWSWTPSSFFDAIETLKSLQPLPTLRQQFCDAFNATVLSHNGFAARLLDSSEPRFIELTYPHAIADRVPISLPEAAEINKWFTDRQLPVDPSLYEVLADAAPSSRTDWYAANRRSLNYKLLRAVRPECFYDATKTYRWNVIAADQVLRLLILLGSGFVFAILLCADVNAISFYRFYRDRLAFAFLQTREKDGGEPRTPPNQKLSDLNTTDFGGPYHLINATLNVARVTSLETVNKQCRDLEADRRDARGFLFSQKYCGSTATGWRETSEYEQYLSEDISLADAMAVSGAVIDPLQFQSLAAAIFGFALNLDIGQWLPNPKFAAPGIPRVYRLLRDIFRLPEKARYFPVSDGGFADNTGVLALLRRRCSLIFALDAGCDPKHKFADLAAVVRLARVHQDVKITSFDAKGAPADGLDILPLMLNRQGFTERNYLIARIQYPKSKHDAKAEGLLVVMKPCLHGTEGVDLLAQRAADRSFPHQSTDDQFYSAQEMESYRRLGQHLAEVVGRLFQGVSAPAEDDLWSNGRLCSAIDFANLGELLAAQQLRTSADSVPNADQGLDDDSSARPQSAQPVTSPADVRPPWDSGREQLQKTLPDTLADRHVRTAGITSPVDPGIESSPDQPIPEVVELFNGFVSRGQASSSADDGTSRKLQPGTAEPPAHGGKRSDGGQSSPKKRKRTPK
ncbi:MAG TPA: patatin-like phospholipase family protein [Pirellulales bacterium]|nr:patatin-like phospholipase family protein [Pirellulales bacterium]